MHEPSATALLQRVDALERQARRSRGLSLVLGTLLATASLGAWITPPGTADVLRARTLIIEDEQGRDRVVLAAPLPSAKGYVREDASTGMVINDTAGHERFGLGLKETGQMSMGFDAAPGDGDPRNPERLNLGVDVNGNGFVRYLDKQTRLAGYLGLRPDNRVWLEFLQVSPDSVIRRRMGLQGDQMLREAR